MSNIDSDLALLDRIRSWHPIIISLGGVIIAVLASWFTMSSRLAAVELKIANQELVATKLADKMDAGFASINKTISERRDVRDAETREMRDTLIELKTIVIDLRNRGVGK